MKADDLVRLRIERWPRDYHPGAFRSREPEIAKYLHDRDAHRDERVSIARTYIVLDEDRCVAYFTLVADAIRLDDSEAQAAEIKYLQAPAIKIARIGVCEDYKAEYLSKQAEKCCLGPLLVSLIIGSAKVYGEKVGIRYVTLDALPRKGLVEAYGRMGFVISSGEQAERIKERPDTEGKEISMRFDLHVRHEDAPAEDGNLLNSAARVH